MMLNDKFAEFYNNVDLEEYKESITKVINSELLEEYTALNDAYENSHYDYSKLGDLLDILEQEILKRMSVGHE